MSGYLAGVLLIVGCVFTLTAAVGLVRLPDVYTRMHAASKAGTLGSCVILIGFGVASGEFAVAIRVAAGVGFFLMTAPIAAHLLARSALDSGYKLSGVSVCDERSTEIKSGTSPDKHY